MLAGAGAANMQRRPVQVEVVVGFAGEAKIVDFVVVAVEETVVEVAEEVDEEEEVEEGFALAFTAVLESGVTVPSPFTPPVVINPSCVQIKKLSDPLETKDD